ncbi:MAG: ChbG/HpnK family deacetylase [Candidatus Moranbacteria bacterium]|nr:ChbG/HpnK family deacetylase [Candidatus Moranbacteria bacterium]
MTKSIRESFVVAADDYGIRQTAEPILRLVHEGKVDRVAVLIHYVSAEQAAALLATGVKIDLHLELIRLLKSGEKVRDNILARGIRFVFRYFSGQVTQRKVEREWREQVERFRELFGRLPDGLNSHEHVHSFPVFFRTFLKLAEEYNIAHIRFGKRGTLIPLHGAFIGRVLSFFWKQTYALYAKTHLVTSDYLVSLDWLPDFKVFSEHLPEGSIELVVHLEREEEYRTVLEYF